LGETWVGTGTCPSTLPTEVDAHVPVRVESNAIPEISINQRFPSLRAKPSPSPSLAAFGLCAAAIAWQRYRRKTQA